MLGGEALQLGGVARRSDAPKQAATEASKDVAAAVAAATEQAASSGEAGEATDS